MGTVSSSAVNQGAWPHTLEAPKNFLPRLWLTKRGAAAWNMYELSPVTVSAFTPRPNIRKHT